MSESYEKEPRTKLTLLVDLLLIAVIVIAFILVFHPFGVGTESEVPEDEVVVAAMLPLDGPLKEFGVRYKQGIEMGVADVNANGGIRGVPLRIEYFNNLGDPDLSVAQMKEIHEMGIPVVIGAIASSNSMAIAPYAETYEIVMLSPGSTTAGLSAFPNYVYRTVSSDVYQGTGMAKIIGGLPSIDEVMIVYLDNLYGKSLHHSLSDELSHSLPNVRVVSEIAILEDEEFDEEFALKEILEKQPDAVILMVYPEQGISIMNAAKNAGVTPVWFGSDMMTSSEVPNGVGEYADGMIGFTQAHKLTLPSFENRYFAEYDASSLDFPVTYGYDSVILLAAVISEGGYSADGIKESLDKIRHFGICGPRFFDENGDVQPAYDIMMIQDGVWLPLKWNQILSYDAVRKREGYQGDLALGH